MICLIKRLKTLRGVKVDKKILIISNNPLSETQNNGKTLFSLFSGCNAQNIAQIYFANSLPNSGKFSNFFRITDSEILSSYKHLKRATGQAVAKVDEAPANAANTGVGNNYFSRFAREIMWKIKSPDKTKMLEWVKNFAPNVIFFMAGDCVFAYDICEFVRKNTGAKLVTYITDDYVLPRQTLSPFFRLRRRMVKKKMQHCLDKSDLAITICEKMRRTYKEIFGKDSICYANNPSEEMARNDAKNCDILRLVYAGGLHLNRWMTLAALGRTIEKHNENSEKKCFLEIYSTDNVSDEIKKAINIKGACGLMGALSGAQTAQKLSECDVCVHVESFDREACERTRLSLSTKIPEYLYHCGCVLAIGPADIGSMEFLKGGALCVNGESEINETLIETLSDSEKREALKEKGRKKYAEFKENNSAEKIMKIIEKI